MFDQRWTAVPEMCRHAARMRPAGKPRDRQSRIAVTLSPADKSLGVEDRLAGGMPRRGTAKGGRTAGAVRAAGSRTLRSSPESGQRAGYDGAKRKKGSKLHLAVDTLGNLLALHVTPANADDRAEVGCLTQAVQVATNESVDVAYVDQGYNGANAASAAEANGIELVVVKLPEAKKGFVLLPRRWVVERSFT